ncbi:MAG: proteasome assembly chaperone family protein [Halobacteriaceae archaeon]
MNETQTATCERFTPVDTKSTTLIEGLPGHGLVASIVVDQITDQLGLNYHAVIRSEEFPRVSSFNDGLVQDTVRIYAGDDPSVMTLKSDIPIPTDAASALSDCIINEFAAECQRAVFLAAAPAQNEESRGQVIGLGTNQAMKDDLITAGVDIASDAGVVGGITGALVNACYQADLPAPLKAEAERIQSRKAQIVEELQSAKEAEQSTSIQARAMYQ